MISDKIRRIAEQFCMNGQLQNVIPIVQGHINDTYRLVTATETGEQQQYALQAINQYVFKQPELVMENICSVTRFLQQKITAAGGDPLRETLNVIPTRTGKSFYVDENGDYWRVYNYISGASTYDTVQNEQHLYHAGYAFGKFQTMLADFPIETLHDTIPDFHNTKKRLNDFFEAVERDVCGRAASVRPEIEFIRRRVDDASYLINLQEQGILPTRVTHNDTKYNNIMIDDITGKALCVIDLDTVMPGLSAYDYGDAIRFAASAAAEDETDLSKVHLDMKLFELFTGGFVSAVAGFLSDDELAALPWGARIITLELASRFLADHLNGDQYFKIHRENHNLDRARSQLALVADMEKRFPEMQAICEKYRKQQIAMDRKA